MTKILIKVATEFNIGLSTIVDYLQLKGFDIDNKPTAKVTDEMYNELLKEFQGSITEKEQAAQLQKIVVPPVKEKISPKPEINLFGTPATPPAPPPPPAPKIKSDKETEEIFKAKLDEADMPKLKVVGKIELEKPEPEVKEVEPPPSEPETIATVEGENEITRVETPTLKGLKILGKIDTNKFKEPSKKKEEPRKQQILLSNHLNLLKKNQMKMQKNVNVNVKKSALMTLVQIIEIPNQTEEELHRMPLKLRRFLKKK
jgi:translation initiation factor IF-2